MTRSVSAGEPPHQQSLPSDAGTKRRSLAATEVLDLANELFEVGKSTSGEAFLIQRAGPNHALVDDGGGIHPVVAAVLSEAALQRFGVIPSSGTMRDVLNILRGRSQRCEPVKVNVRVARHGKDVVIDRGTADGAVIVIRPGKKPKSVQNSPVTFRRSPLTLALPEPASGGQLSLLWRTCNVKKADRDLFIGYLLASLDESIPHPIALITGEQGSGKSSLMRQIAALIDPSPAPARNQLNEKDWHVSATHSWMIGGENLSNLSRISDLLAAAVTGDAYTARTKYSNAGLTVFQFRRIVVLNGIGLTAARADLRDRVLPIQLKRIKASQRRDDAEVQAEFEANRAEALGALYELMSKVLVVAPSVELAQRPRMADFARYLGALDTITGSRAMARYEELLRESAEEAADLDPVTSAIVRYIDEHGGVCGTASQLVNVLGLDKGPRAMSARGMSAALQRARPDLRVQGIDVEKKKRGTRGAIYTLRRGSVVFGFEIDEEAD